MQRSAAVVGSIAVHVAAAVLVLALHEPRADTERIATETTVIELVDLAPPTPRPTTGGGGSPAASTPAPPRPVARRDRDASRSATSTTSVATSLSQLATLAEGTDDRGGDGGEGGGLGGGRGAGIGLGEAGRIEVPELVPAPPPPPAGEVVPVSKARPAKLVYPSREREVEGGELFLARVIVDHEGYVVGARLVRGFGGHRDAQASDLIWRFRYAPALDDSGRAIRSTLEQSFLVGN